MSRLCEGRVAIVTGAGRGIGHEHALSLAQHGAKVVVNDLGGAVDGSGGDISPAQQVVDEIKGMGGEAVANGDSVGSWEGAQRLVDHRGRDVRRPARGGQQRWHPARLADTPLAIFGVVEWLGRSCRRPARRRWRGC